MKPLRPFELYGLTWKPPYTLITATVWLIQHDGMVDGEQVASLFTLYRDLQSILWPDDDHHAWSDLMLQTILENRITVIQGPKDCGKTHVALAKYGLTDYICFPRQTLTLLSSTDLRGLELRVWGDLKDLFIRAREVWPNIPGNPIDSLHGIFSDDLAEDSDVRDIRKGLICIPCVEANGQWKGLERYTGIKQKRRRLLGDEVQFMEPPYITSLANLNKGEFKGVFVGNPIGEGDTLDKLAEPLEGWDGLGEVTTTTTWKNRMGGITINLFGPDSPAIKEPGKYPYLIDQKDIDYIVGYWGKDSAEYWNQAAGVRQPGVSARRVVTRDMARQFDAQEEVVWGPVPPVKVYAVDAGYGGDRCIGGWAEFGKDINGKLILNMPAPKVIPIRIYPRSVPEELRTSPEDQIATFVMGDCQAQGIPASNVFHDATGRGSLGTAFARLWSAQTNPVEFGGAPTPRPVSADLYIYDEKLGRKRLKRCDEHYSKKVSEIAFSVRYVIESGQMRGLTNDVLDELCAREWIRVKLDKIEVESKEDMKPRFGRSPDKADWAGIIVEGARRLGFQISRLAAPTLPDNEDFQWKRKLEDRARRLKDSFQLTYR